MKMSYQFIEDYNLLIQKGSGEWSTEHYIKYIDTILNNKKMVNVTKIFSDLRNINLEKAFQDINLLADLRDKIINLDYTNVHIVSNPISTAIAHLYQDKLISKGFNYNYCSTVKTALILLNLDISENEMEALLNKIENQF